MFNTHVWFLIHSGCHSIIVQEFVENICKQQQKIPQILLVNNIICTDILFFDDNIEIYIYKCTIV